MSITFICDHRLLIIYTYIKIQIVQTLFYGLYETSLITTIWTVFISVKFLNLIINALFNPLLENAKSSARSTYVATIDAIQMLPFSGLRFD